MKASAKDRRRTAITREINTRDSITGESLPSLRLYGNCGTTITARDARLAHEASKSVKFIELLDFLSMGGPR
jgi:hypothetical protein